MKPHWEPPQRASFRFPLCVAQFSLNRHNLREIIPQVADRTKRTFDKKNFPRTRSGHECVCVRGKVLSFSVFLRFIEFAVISYSTHSSIHTTNFQVALGTRTDRLMCCSFFFSPDFPNGLFLEFAENIVPSGVDVMKIF